MSAQKIIALRMIRSTGYDAADDVFDSPFTERSRIGEAWSAAGIAVEALQSAGYRILAPGELEGREADVAAAMWKAEAEDSGAPASIANGRTREAFDEQSDELKARWQKFARAAIRGLNLRSAG